LTGLTKADVHECLEPDDASLDHFVVFATVAPRP
jgi:hypothetical protein